MGDKSIWQGIGDIIGGNGSKGRAKALATVEQRCPQCLNALDPRWTKCPYCEAARNAGNQSARVAPAPAMVMESKPADAPSRRVTQVDMDAPASETRTASAAPTGNGGADDGGVGEGGGDGGGGAGTGGSTGGVGGGGGGGGGGGRRRTIVEPVAEGGVGVERPVNGGGRRLTGIVTTFTWSRLGQLHPIRDGRNYAGSGVVSSDNNTPCEILIAEDRTMSSAHFLILCQGGKYIVSDNFSTNGTFVDGVQIDTRGVELVDNAVIKAGATVFKFQKITSTPGAVEPARKSPQGPSQLPENDRPK